MRAVDLKTALLRIDVTAGSMLEKVYQSFEMTPAAVRQLLRWGGDDDERLQANATWLVKRHAEAGGGFTGPQRNALCGLLGQVTAWPAALHVLQTVARINIPVTHAQDVFERGLDWAESDNKFVRAWAYNALAVVGEQHPPLRAKVQTQLIRGRFDPAASVKARLRHIIEDHDWLT